MSGFSNVPLMVNSLWSHVMSRVRQMVAVSNSNSNDYRDLTKLAVAFTLDAIRDTTLASNRCHSPTSLFQHFTTSIMIKDTRYYLY